jgi:Ni/Co efflux regulator RcnB
MRTVKSESDCSALVLTLIVSAFIACVVACGGGDVTPQQRAAEEQRRASLTPAQREAENKARQEAESRRTEREKEGDQSGAETMAPEFVKRCLKFPDDAEFDWADSAVLTEPINGQRHWLVSGKVKAANALGAKLTHAYCVQLYHKGDGVWQPRSVIIDGEQVFFDSTGERQDEYAAQAKQGEVVQAAQQQQAESRAKARKERQEAVESAKWRTWTDSSGEHQIEAKFEGISNGKVKLVNRDGSTVRLPLEKLSNDDQTWIKEKGWNKSTER